jgi:PP-loop family/TilS substrate C-terminal domain
VQGHIIRPLLNLRREDLREYLKALRQPWREDKTNRDQSRLRARLRHSLLPLLERDYNPHIIEVLNNIATQSHSEETFWNALIETRLASAVTNRDGILAIAIADLLPAPDPSPAHSDISVATHEPSLALARRIILALLHKLAPAARFDSKHIEQVLLLARTSQSGRHIELPHGLRVARNFDHLEFSAARLTTVSPATNSAASKMPPQPLNPAASSLSLSSHAQPPYTYEYAVALRDKTSVTIDVPELDTRFRLKLVDWPSTARETGQCDVLDADLLGQPLALRNWRPGDIYRLPGNGHAQKFKRYFASRRISLRDRPGWPVLSSGPEIAWTRGFVAANFRTKKGSKRGLLVLEG